MSATVWLFVQIFFVILMAVFGKLALRPDLLFKKWPLRCMYACYGLSLVAFAFVFISIMV